MSLCVMKKKKIGSQHTFALIYLLSWHSISDAFLKVCPGIVALLDCLV